MTKQCSTKEAERCISLFRALQQFGQRSKPKDRKQKKTTYHPQPTTYYPAFSFPIPSISSRFLKALILTFALLSLASCTFLYIPPLRDSQELPPSISIVDSSGLFVQADALRLSVQLSDVPEDGWLMVQWFSDSNEAIASDAKWVTSDDVGFAVTYNLPAEIEIKPGDWRAVVSFDSNLLRQFSITIE